MKSNNESVEKIFHDIEYFKSAPAKKFTRKIFMYWHSGLSSAPDIVYLSWALAKINNPDYEVVILDEESIKEYFPYRDLIRSSVTAEIREAHFADILRTYLLLAHGGVWVDVSCFVVRPFSSWLDGIIDRHGYFIGRSDSFFDRRIMNWFMASESGSEVFSIVLENLVKFLTKKRDVILNLTFSPERFCAAELIGPDITDFRAVEDIEKSGNIPYFIYHYVWNDVMNKNEMLRRYFNNLPKIRVPIIKLNRRLFSDVKFIKNRSGGLELDRFIIQSNPDLPPVVKDMILANFG